MSHDTLSLSYHQSSETSNKEARIQTWVRIKKDYIFLYTIASAKLYPVNCQREQVGSQSRECLATGGGHGGPTPIQVKQTSEVTSIISTEEQGACPYIHSHFAFMPFLGLFIHPVVANQFFFFVVIFSQYLGAMFNDSIPPAAILAAAEMFGIMGGPEKQV